LAIQELTQKASIKISFSCQKFIISLLFTNVCDCLYGIDNVHDFRNDAAGGIVVGLRKPEGDTQAAAALPERKGGVHNKDHNTANGILLNKNSYLKR
jgi:hypothetical protein